jgi:hypothetical protein
VRVLAVLPIVDPSQSKAAARRLASARGGYKAPGSRAPHTPAAGPS